MFQRFSLAAGVLSLATMAVEAQQMNPLQSILQTIEKTVPTQEAVTDRMGGDNASMVEILKTYAAGSLAGGGWCEHHTKSSVESAGADFKLGNYSMASTRYLQLAQSASGCAVGKSVNPSLRVPVSQAVDVVGKYLGMSVIAAKAAGYRTPAEVNHARNALTLLSANATANADMIQKVKETGFVGDTTPAPASDMAPIPMTAKNAVSTYKSNEFSFERKYDGKVLRISGTIEKISGSGRRATITLLGHVASSEFDDQGFKDVVRCDVTDPAALDRVMNLKRGDETKVTGLYQPAKQVLKVGIELHGCKPS
ncbi:hypothetical protein MASR1M60_22610 [Rhodocyclaceae bacterium]